MNLQYNSTRIFVYSMERLDIPSGLGEAIDDVVPEFVIGQLQYAVSFVRNNSRKNGGKRVIIEKNCRIIPNVP